MTASHTGRRSPSGCAIRPPCDFCLCEFGSQDCIPFFSSRHCHSLLDVRVTTVREESVPFLRRICEAAVSDFCVGVRHSDIGRRHPIRKVSIEPSRVRRGCIQPIPSHHLTTSRNSLFHGPTGLFTPDVVRTRGQFCTSSARAARSSMLPPSAVDNNSLLWVSALQWSCLLGPSSSLYRGFWLDCQWQLRLAIGIVCSLLTALSFACGRRRVCQQSETLESVYGLNGFWGVCSSGVPIVFQSTSSGSSSLRSVGVLSLSTESDGMERHHVHEDWHPVAASLECCGAPQPVERTLCSTYVWVPGLFANFLVGDIVGQRVYHFEWITPRRSKLGSIPRFPERVVRGTQSTILRDAITEHSCGIIFLVLQPLNDCADLMPRHVKLDGSTCSVTLALLGKSEDEPRAPQIELHSYILCCEPERPWSRPAFAARRVSWCRCVAQARHGIEKDCDTCFQVVSLSGSHVALGWPMDSAASTLGDRREHVVHLSIGLSVVATKWERCARGADEFALTVHCLQVVR